MKRKRSLSDILSNLNLKQKKTDIVCVTEHRDVFEVGKVILDKDFYSKEEVLRIINTREDSLLVKFKKYVFSIPSKKSVGSTFLPRWVN
tara:strand:+ start:81 stop:347 length:267 start_codon:yes stop_codon:yes gene_type:complete